MSRRDNLFVCIMAGGSGERFWPLSRARTPKHLLRLFSDRTLLEETLDRLRPLVPAERLFVLTNASQVDAMLEAVPGLRPDQVIAEPAKRDTAPAAALATAIARRRGGDDAVLLLLPADHVIRDAETFRRNLRDAAEEAATSGALVTLGIAPTGPSSAFGYLKLGGAVTAGAEGSGLRDVEQFVEKPDRATAERYLASGGFVWNAGMFAWRTGSFLTEADRLAPELAGFIRDYGTGDAAACLAEAFPRLPKISVDFAIMEKATRVRCVGSEFDWDDVGSWTAVPAHLPADDQGNTVRGTVVAHGSAGNIAFSTGRTIALCGVEGLIVVETADAVLVCSRARAEEIKKLLPQLPPDALA